MTHLLTRALVLSLCVSLSALVFGGCGGSGSSGSGTAGVTTQTQNSGDPQIVLNVAGTGSGTITSSPASASGRYPVGTSVTLTATPDAGSTFGQWGGAQSGNTSFSLTLVVQADVTLAPEFVVVAAGTPAAEFTTNPAVAQGSAPFAVSFQDTSTAAPTGWIWDFGDGAQDTAQSPSHTYTQPGTYTVTLRAQNANGMGTPAVKTSLVYVARADEGSRFWYVNDRYGNAFKQNDASQTALAQQVLGLVNQERQSAGLQPVQFDAQAETAAKVHSEDMLGRNYFEHNSPEGWDPGDRLRMTGASGFSGYGENIAFGQQTPAAVMQAWMNSAGHRANILNPNFTHLGVGIASGPRWTQVFLTR